VNRWWADPRAHIIMTQDPKTRVGLDEDNMKREYPKAYAYLKRCESVLQVRKTQAVRHLMARGAFYSIFGVGEYTFAPYKVVWREVSSEMDAAVVGPRGVADSRKATVPDHTCILIPCEKKDTAHYLCAVLNSSPVRLAIRSYIVLHPDPHVLKNVRIPMFSEKDRVHLRLAELSEAAHKATASGEATAVKKIEDEIDRIATKLWDLTDQELAEIHASLEEGR